MVLKQLVKSGIEMWKLDTKTYLKFVTLRWIFNLEIFLKTKIKLKKFIWILENQ